MNSEEREAVLGEIAFLLGDALADLAKAEVSEDCGCDYYESARVNLGQALLVLDSLFTEPVVPSSGDNALS